MYEHSPSPPHKSRPEKTLAAKLKSHNQREMLFERRAVQQLHQQAGFFARSWKYHKQIRIIDHIPVSAYKQTHTHKQPCKHITISPSAQRPSVYVRVCVAFGMAFHNRLFARSRHDTEQIEHSANKIMVAFVSSHATVFGSATIIFTKSKSQLSHRKNC